MYISDEIIYLQMQKTGCTHIAKLLEKHCNGKIIGKHEPLTDLSLCDNKAVVSSIRNPWDWYVSLWAYGCSGRGRLYSELTTPFRLRIKQSIMNKSLAEFLILLFNYFEFSHNNIRNIKDLYVDPHNADNFKRWLFFVLGDSGKLTLPEGYSRTKIKEAIGFLSYRFLKLATDYDAWSYAKLNLQSEDEVRKFYVAHNILDDTIRFETLEMDLSRILAAHGIKISEGELMKEGKTNTSERCPYQYYYDEEAKEIVRKRDWLIIDLFNYSFS